MILSMEVYSFSRTSFVSSRCIVSLVTHKDHSCHPPQLAVCLHLSGDDRFLNWFNWSLGEESFHVQGCPATIKIRNEKVTESRFCCFEFVNLVRFKINDKHPQSTEELLLWQPTQQSVTCVHSNTVYYTPTPTSNVVIYLVIGQLKITFKDIFSWGRVHGHM